MDPAVVPADAVGYRDTPEEVWGPLLPALPPDVLQTVEVPDAWFDVSASSGPFPLVVISHGFGTMRCSYAVHAAHLASAGDQIVRTPTEPAAGQ